MYGTEDVVIDIQDLSRDYVVHSGLFGRTTKTTHALNKVTFQVRRGEVFGLLGPNGAGKTTTIKIMSTLLAPTSGSAKVLGHDVFREAQRIRQSINLISGGERTVYWRLTGRQNLQYFADLYKVPRQVQRKLVPECLELVGLSKAADDRVETYSKGMKQKLQIARGLLNNPAILFMDEPSLGLDPVSAQDLRRLIRRMQERGTTVILTTHYMFEADQLSDRIAIINKGQLIALDTPANLKRHAAGLSVLELHTTGLSSDMTSRLRSLQGVISLSVKAIEQRQLVELQTESPYDVLEQVKAVIAPDLIIRTNVRDSTLEDAYIKLVGV